MSNFGGADDVTVSAVADEQSLLALTAAVENAIGKGFEKGFKGLGVGLDRQTKAISASIESSMQQGFKAGFADLEKIMGRFANGRGFKNLESAIKDAFTGGSTKSFLTELEKVDAQMLSLVARLKKMDAAVSVQSATVAATGTGLAKEAIQRNIEIAKAADRANQIQKASDKERAISLNAANQERLVLTKQAGAAELAIQRANLDAVGREQRQAGELAVVQARNSGRLRIAAARAAFDGIIAIEKGLGSAVAGIARTATSAVSRLFSGLGNTITREVRESNNTFTTGLSSSLTERESILRDSFRDQERIIRTSVTRQEAQLTKLRSIGSTGVAGAVTGRGLGIGIGGLIAGAGIGSLISGAFKDSTNLTEQLSKNQILFGQYTQQVVDFSKTSVLALGRTQAEALESTGVFGNLFLSFGDAADKAAEKSIVFTQLATDMASFGNTTVDEAFTALSAGLVGESEPLKRFGVILNDLTLKEKALELGLYSGKGVLDTNAKAQAAYAIILEKTSLQQGNYADTAREGANAQRTASAAVREFLSTVVGVTKPLTTALANGIVPVFVTLKNLVTGEGLSEAMLVFRDAVKGVAIALAGILAAKAAVQIFQLIGVAVSAALTPMGALILVAAAVGAALGILLPRSEALRTALSKGIEAVKGYAESAREFLVPILERVATFVTEVGIPAFLRLADVVRDYLVRGFGIAARFITGTVVPALKTAFVETAGFITDTALPAIRSFIDYLGDEVAPKLVVAAEAVQRFFERVKDAVGNSGLAAIAAGLAGLALGGPIIAAAVAGLAYVGTKIVQSFDGFENLPSTALAVLKDIGSDILKVLEPVRKTVVAFFQDLFSLDTLGSIGSGILTAIEFVGRKLGELVSSKTFVRSLALAAAGIVAAAVLVGASFLKGFAQGVVQNAPETLRYIRDAIIDGLKLLLNPETLAVVFLAAFAITKLIAPVIRAFRGLGSEAGTSFGSGLKSSLSKVGGFIQGALGTADRSNLVGANKATNKEIQATSNAFRVLGSPQVVDLRNLDDMKRKLGELRGGFTDAQFAGLQFKDRLNAGFQAVTGTIKGISGALGGVVKIAGTVAGAALTPFSTGTFKSGISAGFGQIKKSFQDTLAGLRTIAAEQGTTIGRAFGAKVAGGAAVAFGGFVAGKAEGSAGGSGVLSAVGAGLTGLAVGGPIVGAAAAGIALIGTKFGQADAKARAFRESVKKIASGIKTELTQAIEDGLIALGDLRDGLDIGEVSGFDAVETAFKDAFGDKGIGLLAKFGVVYKRDVLPVLQRAPKDASALRDSIIDAASASDEFATIFGKNASAVAKKVKEILAPGGATGITALDIQDLFGDLNFDDFSAVRDAIEDLISLGGGATKAFNATREALKAVNNEAAFFNPPPPPIPTTSVAPPFPMAGLGFGLPTAPGLIPGGQEAMLAALGLNQPIVIPMPTIDSASLETAAANVQGALSELDTQAAEVNAQIQALFNPPPANQDLFTQIDNAILSVAGIGAQIQEQVIAGSTAGATPGAVAIANSMTNRLREELSGEFATVIQKGIADNVIVDESTARTFTSGILDAALEGVTDQGIRDGIIENYNTAIAGLPPLIAESKAIADATVAGNAINQYFADNKINPELETEQSLSDYLTAAGQYFIDNPIKPGVEADTDEARLAAAEIVTAMLTAIGTGPDTTFIGDAVAQGIINGMNSKKQAVIDAAKALTQQIAIQAAGVLFIESPSKLMVQYGEYVGEGLVLGMDNRVQAVGFSAATLGQTIGEKISDALIESGGGISGILTNILDEAFSSATSLMTQKTTALSAGFAGLFGGTVGSGALGAGGLVSVGQGSQALGALTTTFQGILTGLEGNASTLASILEQQANLAKGVKDTPALTPSQLNILGESSTSLSPFDILGVANIGQLTSAFDAIASFGQTLLAQGNTPQIVASSVNTYVQQLIDMATSVGFSTDEVTHLAISMGLSQEAMAGFVQSASAAAYAFDVAQLKATQQAKADEEAANAQAALELAAEYTTYEFNQLLPSLQRAAAKTAGFADAMELATIKQMLIFAQMNDPNSPTGAGPYDPNKAPAAPYSDEPYYDRNTGKMTDPRTGLPVPEDGQDPVLANLPRPITNHIYLPYGDPEAVALAVTNRIVQDARLPD